MKYKYVFGYIISPLRFVIRSEVAQIGVFSLLQYLYLSINKNFSTISEFLFFRESVPIYIGFSEQQRT